MNRMLTFTVKSQEDIKSVTGETYVATCYEWCMLVAVASGVNKHIAMFWLRSALERKWFTANDINTLFAKK